jgi:hypothetical protein
MELSVTLLFSAIYHMNPETASKTSTLSINEPETSQIPVKKRAAIETIPFLTLFPDVIENLTANIKITATSIIWKIMPLLAGSPNEFTKNQSNFEDIVTKPGMMPYISKARSTMDVVKETAKPRQENSNFLK